MHLYEVGKLYNPNKTRWEPGVQFSIRKGQAELILIFDRPSSDEILSVKKAPCEFGIAAIGDVIFFFYKFGSQIAWSDQPFTFHLVAEDERALPELATDETRLTLSITLVDARTGIIKAMRLASLSPEFSRELLKLTREQLQKPYDATSYDLQIAQIYAKYPSTRDLMLDVWTMTSGGE